MKWVTACISYVTLLALATAFCIASDTACVWFVPLIGLLLCKLVAISEGIGWIWMQGPKWCRRLPKRDLRLSQASAFERKQMVYRVFSVFRPSWWLLGIMDWKWFAAIDFLRTRNNRGLNFAGWLLALTRTTLFRVENLLLFGTLMLALRPYSPSDGIDTLEVLAFLSSFLLMLLIAFMGTEVFIGNVILQLGYSRYFHLRFERDQTHWNDPRDRVREVRHFVRFALLSVLTFTAICQSYYGTRFSFDGIKATGWYGDSLQPIGQKGQWLAELWSFLIVRGRLFAEFLYFMSTTFTTIGYGDIYAKCVGSRVLMIAIHCLTIAMVLVLLQTILTVGAPSEDEG